MRIAVRTVENGLPLVDRYLYSLMDDRATLGLRSIPPSAASTVGKLGSIKCLPRTGGTSHTVCVYTAID